jgi:hypothetical protein
MKHLNLIANTIGYRVIRGSYQGDKGYYIMPLEGYGLGCYCGTLDEVARRLATKIQLQLEKAA